jgi:hypothetical protein
MRREGRPQTLKWVATIDVFLTAGLYSRHEPTVSKALAVLPACQQRNVMRIRLEAKARTATRGSQRLHFYK